MSIRDRFFVRAVAALAALALAAGVAAAAAPVVPGYSRLKDEAKGPAAEPAALGELLLGELNCTACHTAPDASPQRILTKGAPDLTAAGSRLTPQFIREWLSGPHAVQPGTTMPDVFHASEPQAKQGAVEFITHYLVSLGGPIAASADEGNSVVVDRGRELFHTVGCVACHAPLKQAEQPAGIPAGNPQVPPDKDPAKRDVPSVPLNNLGSYTTVEQLTAFLLDPLKVRPDSRMPSSNLATDEARAIAVYLLREQMENPQVSDAGPARTRGLHYIYYDVQAHTAAVELIDPLVKTAEGKVEKFTTQIPDLKPNNTALKFSGVVAIPRDGKYTFWTKSDDGSRLYIDNNLVVDNDGTHAPTEKTGSVELKKGDHAIVVTFFQGGGGYELTVEWEGPEIKRQEVPADVLFSVGGRPMVPLKNEEFFLDRQKAQMGRQMFAVLGCVNCHQMPDAQQARPAKALANLNVDSADGCLADKVRKGLPQYHLADDQRAALKAAVTNAGSFNKPLEPGDLVVRTMAAFNCFACHTRTDAAATGGATIGGPTPARKEYFTMVASFDMGDEGYVPPKLTEAGAKLTATALEQVIFEGNLHIRRHHMATRMPKFARDKAGHLVDALAKADAPAADEARFAETAARDGRTLVGVKGLGCINCHGVAGNKSLGMPSVDLSTAHGRLRHQWFSDLLHNPAHKNPGTRMPAFWEGDRVVYPNLAGGTAQGQIDAIWAYLSLGKSMGLPSGMVVQDSLELIPIDEPIVHRTFMADVGARAVLVGYPDNLHVAFDANVVRLAKAWRGRFFDAKGMWVDRGGAHNPPLGTDVIALPPGPSFAVLAAPDAPWPAPKEKYDRNLGGKFQGYVLDKAGVPTFRYTLNGVEIQERAEPLLKAGGPVLSRRFQLSAKEKPPGGTLYFQAAAGGKVEQKSPGVWTVDDKLTITLASKGGAAGVNPLVRDGAGGRQLLVPVTFDNDGKAVIELAMSW